MKSEILKELRKDKGLTQKQLSEKLGVARSLIGMVEAGKQDGGREFAKKVAEYFNVSLDYLEGLTTEKTGLGKEKEALVSNFLEFLIENGIIKDEKNIDEKTEKMIMDMVKMITLKPNVHSLLSPRRDREAEKWQPAFPSSTTRTNAASRLDMPNLRPSRSGISR